MTAISSAFAKALTEAQAQAGGNRKPPTIATQQAGFNADPTFAAMFRAARDSAQAALSIAEAHNRFIGDADSLHALQRAQHSVEEVERQITVARELVTFALDVDAEVLRNATRVDSWMAAIGTRADKLARRATQ